MVSDSSKSGLKLGYTWIIFFIQPVGWPQTTSKVDAGIPSARTLQCDSNRNTLISTAAADRMRIFQQVHLTASVTSGATHRSKFGRSLLLNPCVPAFTVYMLFQQSNHHQTIFVDQKGWNCFLLPMEIKITSRYSYKHCGIGACLQLKYIHTTLWTKTYLQLPYTLHIANYIFMLWQKTVERKWKRAVYGSEIPLFVTAAYLVTFSHTGQYHFIVSPRVVSAIGFIVKQGQVPQVLEPHFTLEINHWRSPFLTSCN